MYKVKYTKMSMNNNNSICNITQGYGVAYVDAELNEIEEKLQRHLAKSKIYPIINDIVGCIEFLFTGIS